MMNTVIDHQRESIFRNCSTGNDEGTGIKTPVILAHFEPV